MKSLLLSVDPFRRVVRYTAREGSHRLGGYVMFRMTKPDSLPMRPRVTPDPERAAELQRRIDALQYRPETGFHRDRLQGKTERPALRLVK
ncbi:hypothetical protein [Steroidobacter cummioxidans]|uniref:hypothetical protein n=1 Tax=Steroidobacter cummioxidans TaxID=1803913 RepID=UPI0012907F71|nr:hypothetical protein [Steroidobacter cummioxidans]